MFKTRKEYFLSKFQDPHLFDCMEFNVLKVAQSGIKRGLNQDTVKRNLIDMPIWVTKLVYVLKWIKSGFVSEKKIKNNCLTLFIQMNRFLKSGTNERVSIYSKRFSDILDAEETLFLTNGLPDMSLNYSPSMISIAEFYGNGNLLITKDEARLISELKKTYNRVCQLSDFTENELVSIKVILHEFFISYRIWYRFLKGGNVRKSYFICPYTAESIVLAMQRANIEIIELQHGIIGTGSDFYIYPSSVIPVRDKMLLADKVWVFGRYWKEMLLRGSEYNENQIEIIGDYYYRDLLGNKEKELNSLYGEKKIILLITQYVTNSQYFIEYALFLQQHLGCMNSNEFVIVIKPHPNEKYEDYSMIASENIKISNMETELLLKNAHWVISIYSAVLFEALRYKKRCFTLLVDEYEVFVNQLLESNAFEGLEMNTFPKDYKYDNDVSEQFYGEFNSHMLLNKEAS
jgi:hypothetical protein